MTPVQVRMAQAALELSTEDLSRKAGLSPADVEQILHGGHDGISTAKLRTTFEGAGVVFLAEDGVRFDDAHLGAQTVPLEEMNSYNDE